MTVTVAKEFRWEGAHRLPWHEGPCKNVHGHSYRLTVELTGTPPASGMLIDFQEVKRILKPLIDAFDHATLVAEDDAPLREALQHMSSKTYVLPFDSTSENLCRYVLDYLQAEGTEVLRRHCVSEMRVEVRETDTCYATMGRPVDEAAARAAEGVAGEVQPIPPS